MFDNTFLQRYIFITLSLCLQETARTHSVISFPLRIYWSQSLSQLVHPNPWFIPTLNSSRTHLCFPFPPAHKSLSYITGRQRDTLHCTTSSRCAHIGNKQRQAQKEEGQRETDFYFPWSDMLFCRYKISYKCTNFRLLTNIIYVHRGVLISEHSFSAFSLIVRRIPSRVIQFSLPTNHNKCKLPEKLNGTVLCQATENRSRLNLFQFTPIGYE